MCKFIRQYYTCGHEGYLKRIPGQECHRHLKYGVDCRFSQDANIEKKGVWRIQQKCIACQHLEVLAESMPACPFGIGIAPFIPENCPVKSTCKVCPGKLKEKAEEEEKKKKKKEDEEMGGNGEE